MERLKELLDQIGLEPERVRMVNLSAAMAGEFAARATEMSEQVSALGPNPLHTPNGTGGEEIPGGRAGKAGTQE